MSEKRIVEKENFAVDPLDVGVRWLITFILSPLRHFFFILFFRQRGQLIQSKSAEKDYVSFFFPRLRGESKTPANYQGECSDVRIRSKVTEKQNDPM